jgi:hypothetical protein
MRVQKYDWRARMNEAAGVDDPSAKSLKDIAESSTKGDRQGNWRFKETIRSTIELVEAEEQAKREREAVEKAQFDKARQRATTVRDNVVLPLLNDLHDNFAVHKRKVLPQWEIHTREDAEGLSAVAVTPNIDADETTHLTIEASASVADRGEFVSMSVVCSLVNSKSVSANRVVHLFEKTAKFLTAQKLDELSARSWYHKQLSQCVRLCVLTKMRQFPATAVDSHVAACP